ncbi:MAG TPA: hypothetical protein PLX17_02300 [Chitinophagaceae bacterium]|nr:hypothetical protein [Chitinophagaceae bacterium]
MDSISLYEDAARLLANKDENGYWSYSMFNQGIRIASNRVLDYITGDASNQNLPISYSTQKAKDFIATLITAYSAPITNGVITRPSDYYHYDNLYILSLSQTGCEVDNTNCDEDSPVAEIIKTPAEMLDGQQFYVRAQTYISGLKPSPKKPICKMIGNTIEFLPRELGSCTLEYIRYPIYGTINTIQDPVYYNEVADPATSIDNEFGEWARELILYYLVQGFSTHISEASLFQMNEAAGKR